MLLRFTSKQRARGWGVPPHAILLAAGPVLFLFAENAAQQVTLGPLWRPLLVAVLAAALLLAACTAALRDPARGGLLAGVLVALFMSFGHVWNGLSATLPDPSWLAAIWALIALAAAWLIRRGGRWVPATNSFLTVAASLFLVINAVRVGDFALGGIGPVDTSVEEAPIQVDAGAPRPDVYYIILDRFAGADILREVYDVDPDPFLAELERRGFQVADESWANYFKTALSLVSSLNMEYLDPDRYDDSDPDSFDRIHAALRERLRVPATLKALGYEYVHIANTWEPTATNVDADIVLRYEAGSEFELAVMATTPLRLLGPAVLPDENDESVPFPELAREHVLYGFDRLEEAAQRPGPTYVFAHILVPHPPYVFDIDGSMPTEEERRRWGQLEEYRRQVTWAQGRLLEALDAILASPGGDQAVIVFQADEGAWPLRFGADQTDFQWLEATEQEIHWKYSIMNAIRAPGMDLEAAGFHERLSPVNEFRVVFNALFGSDLPILPDRVFLSPDYAHTWSFREYRRPD
ncbi:MAG TPA: hypothetical protein VFH63_00035 [candidate division Zixibacteria bacterium]|nr:hypothetical protein [candidate division Zixibacteria bacterium]